jgi:hypothetical protein
VVVRADCGKFLDIRVKCRRDGCDVAGGECSGQHLGELLLLCRADGVAVSLNVFNKECVIVSALPLEHRVTMARCTV